MRSHLRESFNLLVNPYRFFSKIHVKNIYDGGFRFAIVNVLSFSFLIGLALFLLGPDKKTFFVSIILVVALVISGIVELFIFSISFHLFLKMMGARREFEATFGVVSYSSAVLLYAWILPLVVFVPFHVLYVLSSGFMRVHKVSRLRAIAAIVLPFAIGGLMLYVLIYSAGLDGIINLLRAFYAVKIF
ncbi:MAG: YIP1 family protein [archaeon]